MSQIEHAIHIWTGRFSEIIGNDAYSSSILSADEIERAARFVFDRDREKYVAGRAILRNVLANYEDAKPENLQFTYNQFGKPVLDSARSTVFNVSHAEDLLCIAVLATDSGNDEAASPVRLGVDVEYTDREIPFDEVASSHFSPEEVIQLSDYQDKRRPFFRCWTRKEAYIKAHGTGVSYGLDAFGVSLEENERSSIMFDRTNDISCWSVYSWQEHEVYFGALAVDIPGERIEHHTLEARAHLLAS